MLPAAPPDTSSKAGAAVGASVRIRSVPRRRFTPALLEELHALANGLMREPLEHFCVHAHTNDVVHLFERSDTRAIVGFQFWRTITLQLPRTRAIVGGKLRILPAYRRQGLHLRSGLRFFASRQLAHPRTRFYRISIASIFGFTSIASALAEYHLFAPQAADPEGHALAGAFQQLARGSSYQLARDEAVIRVNIFITPETLALYPDAFFEKPAARLYAAINPGYRSNGSYVGFWFRFSRRNLVALVQAVRQLRSRR